MASDSCVWTIEISIAQEEAIRELFRHNNWELNVVELTSLPDSAIISHLSDTLVDTSDNVRTNSLPIIQFQDQSERPEVTPSVLERTVEVVQEERSNPSVGASNTQNNDTDGYIDNHEGCQFCFCDPCVTTYRPRWLGSGQGPRAGNNLLRKTRYKKYWKLLKDRGAWDHPRYIIKKAAAQGHDQNDYAWLPSVREIMPDCVLKLVRNLYPNLSGIPYMGHRWM